MAPVTKLRARRRLSKRQPKRRICVIVRGSGTLHCRDTEEPIASGSAFHVAPRLLHALENPNSADLWVLGVFRPEGSAAAAFYPDGTPAPNNED